MEPTEPFVPAVPLEPASCGCERNCRSQSFPPSFSSLGGFQLESAPGNKVLSPVPHLIDTSVHPSWLSVAFVAL